MLVVTTVAAQQSDYPITPVDFTRVKITDNFWRSRMETNEKVTIPHAIKKNREDGRVDNFIFAAGIKKGKWKGAFGFNDTDVYKTLEGMAFTYQLNRSEVLSKEMVPHNFPTVIFIQRGISGRGITTMPGVCTAKNPTISFREVMSFTIQGTCMKRQ